jgi:transposase
MSYRFYLGIDVAKAKLDCSLLDTTTNKRKAKSIANTSAGYAALLTWLGKQDAALTDIHVILEPTGVYHEQATFALSDAGLTLSLINPAQLRKFAQGIGVKSKTDALDSAVLSRYGATNQPPAWKPPSASARQLRALLARRDAVADDLQREKNRAEAAAATETPPLVQTSINDAIAFLTKELKRLQQEITQHIDRDPDLRNTKGLLETIPGVGQRVSDHMTALLAARDFQSAEQLAAYLGLVPVEWQSGSSIKGRPHMSKAGPSHLRKLLYLPAVGAKLCNPHIKALYDRLIESGKPKMAAIGAAMRKLAHLCFGVVKSGKPYDSSWLIRT